MICALSVDDMGFYHSCPQGDRHFRVLLLRLEDRTAGIVLHLARSHLSAGHLCLRENDKTLVDDTIGVRNGSERADYGLAFRAALLMPGPSVAGQESIRLGRAPGAGLVECQRGSLLPFPLFQHGVDEGPGQLNLVGAGE